MPEERLAEPERGRRAPGQATKAVASACVWAVLVPLATGPGAWPISRSSAASEPAPASAPARIREDLASAAAVDRVAWTAPGASDRSPAANAFRSWFVTRSGCFDRSGSGRERRCTLADNLQGFTLYYGDAGRGPDGDVLVLATIATDPTGNGSEPLVGYVRRDSPRYRFVKEFREVPAYDLAPGTGVRFSLGRISFVGVTRRENDGRHEATGRTVFDLRVE